MSNERTSTLRLALEAISVALPLFVIAEVFILGLFPTLSQMLRHPCWITSASRWRDSFLHAAQPSLMAMADKMFSDEKCKLVSQAKGRIMEVGPGTGETVKYYDKSKVDIVYGVEPDLVSIASLNAQLVKHGLLEKYKVLPFGVKDTNMMDGTGVVSGSIDTVVCVLPSSSEITNDRSCVFVQFQRQRRSCLHSTHISNLGAVC